MHLPDKPHCWDRRQTVVEVLKSQVPNPFRPYQVDRGQFDQVIINLAVNARDAMPGGGSVTVRSSDVILHEPVQRGHDLMPAGQYALIEVIDTGEGISKENLDRIFR